MGNKIKQKYFRRLSQYSGMLFVVLVGLVIFPLARLDNDTQATITPSTTNITLSTSDLSAEITPSSTSGTFVASDPATISVVTNNYSGYTLGISASDNVNNTKLINTNDNTAYLNSISSASSADEFNSNNWGYLPSKLNSQANTNYQPAPTTTATTLDATNTANAEANTYTIALGAKADYSLPSGTYENSFTLTAVANPVNYTITYNKNTEDMVENMPSNQSGTIENADITISNTTPTREHYTFQGWCSVATTTTSNNTDSCSGNTYQPGDTINVNKTTANITTLYAMWKMDAFTINFNANNGTGTMPAQMVYGTSASLNTSTFTRSGYVFTGWNTVAGGSGTSYSDGGTFTVPASGTSITLYTQWSNKIQDYTNDNCPTTATIAYDSRDNTAYHVQKLADGRCWMLDNLALDLTNSTVKSALSASNTNATATSISRLKNGGGTTSDKYATAGVASWVSGSAGSYSAPLVNMTRKNEVPNNPPTAGKGYNKMGGFYNYCAASAGSYCYGNGTDAGISFGDATEDICPKGWRMPTGGTSGEYQSLINKYGTMSDSDIRNLLSIAYTGYLDDDNGVISATGSHFRLWSSTRLKDDDMSFVYSNGSYINMASYGERNYGRSIRCITTSGSNVTITFNANGGTGTMSPQTITGGVGTIKSNTFTRSGYIFIGWSTAANPTSSSSSYREGGEYVGSSTTLYAQWSNKIQDIITDACPTAATIVYDNRDNTAYHIQKLADGRCWMLDNLALDLTNSTVKSALSASNTNATYTSISRLKNGGGTTSDQYATAGVASWASGSAGSYSAPLVNMTKKDEIPANAPTNGKGYNKVGGYYNYCAASAGSYCYGNGTTSAGTSSGNATEDICPKGWRMPTGDSSGEYKNLANAYGISSTESFRNILSIPNNGYIDQKGNISATGTGGHLRLWSSTRYSDESMYFVYANGPSYINTASHGERNYGRGIRCIAK